MKKKIIIFVVLFAVFAVAIFTLTRPKAVPPSPVVPNPVSGLITHASAESITLKMNDSQEVTFKNRQNVPLDHLIEHKEDKWKVSVIWRYEGTGKIATRVDDVE